jgi:hypothetical protein
MMELFMPKLFAGAAKESPTQSLEAVIREELLLAGEATSDYDYERSLRPSGYMGSPPEWPEQPSPQLASKLFDKKLTALCLSGGGIRSATFCLGVLQALSKQNLLSHFHYLSTVSGGGYIGAWLTGWASRPGSSMESVERALSATDQEPKQLTNLRDFTNYLTPRVGLFSLDSWTFLSTFVRNLVLNWLLLLPMFLLVVWAPKTTALIFELVEDELSASSDRTPYFALFAVTAAFYGSAIGLSSAQLRQVKTEVDSESPGEGQKQYGYGTTQYFLRILLPSQIAAIGATVVLARFPYELTSLATLAAFAIGGALIWTIPFLVSVFAKGAPVSFTWPSSFWGRILGGAVFGLLLALGFSLIQPDSVYDDRVVLVAGAVIFMLAHMFGQIIFSALTSEITRFDDVLEWAARAAAAWLMVCLVWTISATLVLWTPELKAMLFDGLGAWGRSLVPTSGLLAGAASALLGKSRRSPGGPNETKFSAYDPTKVAIFCALIFFLVLFFELSVLFDLVVLQGESVGALLKDHLVTRRDIGYVAIALVVLLLWRSFASRNININRFSLHAFYRNRLIRAYLGASHDSRNANAFTGFDQGDNLDMCGLHEGKPVLIANTALNLVHGKRLAWQERKASSFTVSRCAAGNPAVGYRPSDKYGNSISLGTAMGISGAAISPNMGYHSAPILAFIMTLFNARLGWWLGNPCRAFWKEGSPRDSSTAIIKELFGLTDDDSDYVYLSDGGHFENLGVYEMLRRRCRTIVVIDAGCDPLLKYEDLGNLVRKARIDFNIEITFAEPSPPSAGCERVRLGLVNQPKPPCAAPYCIIGDIAYPDVQGETASLIYVKAAIHGDEPEDVWAYAASHPEFPHESTGDQFFSESQFESYRRLGLHIGSKIFAGTKKSREHAADLVERVKAHCG